MLSNISNSRQFPTPRRSEEVLAMQDVSVEQAPADAAVGWVYVIGAPGSSVVKIGRSSNLAKRLSVIQTGSHDKVVVRWTTPGGRQLERALHEEFQLFRKHGEWFDFGEDDPVVLVRAAVERITGEPAPLEFEVGARMPRAVAPEPLRRPHPLHPAQNDPDRGDPLYQPDGNGCRMLTPTEIAAGGAAPDLTAEWWCTGCGFDHGFPM
jgi:hypothetical protein